MAHKPVIIHLSNDYPDPLEPHKTKAIFNLVEGTPEFRHIVYSLNRVSRWSGVGALPFGEGRLAVAYGALPKGLFWKARLTDLAKWIEADLRARGIVPDLIEAHKYTVEGIVGLHLSDAFNCPLVVDIQGGTDVNILKKKPSLRSLYKKIGERASVVFPYSPWMIQPFIDKVSLQKDKITCLPVVSGVDALLPPQIVAVPRLVSVFHLNQWRRKNFLGLIRAVKFLSQAYPAITLDVYGGGSPKTVLEMTDVIHREGVSQFVTLKGIVKNDQVSSVMNGYTAFVMPTEVETYGLVFAEALFAGLPVLYSKGRSIDGYFPSEKIGYACDPYSQRDIQVGISHIINNQVAIKESIAGMQMSGELEILRRASILDTYRHGLQKALSK